MGVSAEGRRHCGGIAWPSAWSSDRPGLGQRPDDRLAVVLAFLFGYSFTSVPVLRSGPAPAAALGVAPAALAFVVTVPVNLP